MRRNGSAAAPGRALAQFAQTLFSPTFPLALVTLCAVSYGVAAWLHSPELGFWGYFALSALFYAQRHTWAAILIGLAVLGALPLAWLAARGRAAGAAKTLAEWLVAVVVLGFAFWLRTAWPYNASDMQVFAYSFLLFIGWSALIEATVDTLALLGRGRIRAR